MEQFICKSFQCKFSTVESNCIISNEKCTSQKEKEECMKCSYCAKQKRCKRKNKTE